MRATLTVLIALLALPAAAAASLTFANPGFDTDAAGWSTANIDRNGGWRSTDGNPGGLFILNYNGPCESDPQAWQTITDLTVGNTYRISVDHRNYYSAAFTNEFAIFVDGVHLATADSTASWQTFQAAFEATATSHTIAFHGEYDCTDGDVAIDNVLLDSISAAPPVPEPATLVLVGVGVIAVAAVALRRQ